MRVLSSLFLSILLLVLVNTHTEAAKITADYNEIEFATLKITPEKYDKKKVIYSETYQQYSTTFPEYMERSGLSSKKNLLLSIGDFKIPAVCKKTDTMVTFISKLKRGSTVKVYGKVRRFRADKRTPKGGKAAEYYVEVEKIELVEEPKQNDARDANNDRGDAEQEDRQNKKRRPPRFKR
jgi:hypothetical protein